MAMIRIFFLYKRLYFVNIWSALMNVMQQRISTNGYKRLVCCQGYRILQGKCEKCQTGRYSTNCDRPCPNSFYGDGCLFRCDCNDNEYCDTVLGCTKAGHGTIKTVLLSIGIPLTCLLLTIAMVFGIRKRILKKKRVQIKVISNKNSTTDDYDYIDESMLENICRNNDVAVSQPVVITTFIHKESNPVNLDNTSVSSLSQNSSFQEDGYLNPYNTLQTELNPDPYDVPL